MNRTHIIKTAFMPLGKASVLVEYELVDDEAQVLNVMVNGMWTDPQNWIDSDLFDQWQAELTRSHREDMARIQEDGAAMLRRVMDGQSAYLLSAAQQSGMDETMGYARGVRA